MNEIFNEYPKIVLLYDLAWLKIINESEYCGVYDSRPRGIPFFGNHERTQIVN